MRGTCLCLRLNPLAILTSLVLAGACDGANKVTSPAPADLSGEYTYEITASGGNCDELPSSSGSGVTRVSQTGETASLCWQSQKCSGEHCWHGTVEGNQFTYRSTMDLTKDSCTFRKRTTVIDVLQAGGILAERIDNAYTYQSGDCSDRTLPCTTWQTTINTPCPAPCYDELCLQTMPKQETWTFDDRR